MPRRKRKSMTGIDNGFDDERADLETYPLTLEEMSCPDWRERLERAEREVGGRELHYPGGVS